MARRRRKNGKKLGLLLFLVLLIVAGVVGYFVWDGYFREDKEEDETTEVVENKPNEDEGGKGSFDIAEEIEKEKEPVVQYEGEDPNESEKLTGVVTYAGVAGDKLMIRVNIDQYLEDGVCELSLMQGGAKYSDSAKINSVTTATCEGFDVPVSELGGGNYQIVIKISAEGKTGTISGEAEV